MMTPNRQLKNVGNRGDQHKHLALIALAELLKAHPGACHIETHSFLLHAPLPESAPMTALTGKIPAIYQALQAPYLQNGRYRCSAGLARDVLGPQTRLILAEAHADTRHQLVQQIQAESANAHVVEEAAALGQLPLPPGPRLIHVDPFEHPLTVWPVVEKLVQSAHPCIVLCFAWDKTAAIHWPNAPTGLHWIGERPDPPYGLAAWASAELLGAAQTALAPLGWLMHSAHSASRLQPPLPQ